MSENKEELFIKEFSINEPRIKKGMKRAGLLFSVNFKGEKKSYVFDKKKGEIWQSSGSFCEVWTVGSYYVLTSIFGMSPFAVIPNGTLSKLSDFLKEKYPHAEVLIKR